MLEYIAQLLGVPPGGRLLDDDVVCKLLCLPGRALPELFPAQVDKYGLIRIPSLVVYCMASPARTAVNESVEQRQRLWQKLYELKSPSPFECWMAFRGRNIGVHPPSWQFSELQQLVQQSITRVVNSKFSSQPSQLAGVELRGWKRTSHQSCAHRKPLQTTNSRT